MASLRTPETEQKYLEHIKNGGLNHTCPLCAREPVKAFMYWKVISNNFPYDRVAERHDMLVPLRHASGDELTQDEWLELAEIKKGFITETYVYIIEATKNFKSIPAHFHLHLITLKE